MTDEKLMVRSPECVDRKASTKLQDDGRTDKTKKHRGRLHDLSSCDQEKQDRT